MTNIFAVRSFALLLTVSSAQPLHAVEANKPGPINSNQQAKEEILSDRLKPGPDDARIANFTARLLQQFHYSQHPFDDLVSSNLLVRYMNDLERYAGGQHFYFLQSDVAEFETYQDKLDDMIMKRGDTRPARLIFSRFLQRLEEHVAYVDELLKTGKFDFTVRERVTLNRKDLPYPKDMDEARKLARERLLYEYLQEKLILEKPAKPAEPDKDAKESKPKSPGEIHDEIVKMLSHRYARLLKTFKDWDADDVLEFYLTALTHVYDPHSDYMGKSQLDSFSISMNLALFGIGAQLTSDDGYCKIDKLVPGPAMKSKKLKPNDKIISVAQGEQPPVDVVDMPLPKVVSLIRGAKGTEVRLTIIPADAPSTRTVVSLFRDEIKLEDGEAKAKIIELPSSKDESFRLGIIDLPSFYAPMDVSAARDKPEQRFTSVDVAKLLKKLKEEKVSGIILDLRRNGGGSLEEAIKLTGLFIKQGPVVQVRDPNGDVTVDRDKDPKLLFDGPLIVLTSRFSASASEIVAGALQDYGRALIVGESSTHGKGTVQSLNSLRLLREFKDATPTNDPGALKVTIRKFYRPSGSSTQLKGVIPDIVLPSKFNVMEVGESSLGNPLPWDTIDSAEYEHLNRVAPYLEALRKRSAERTASDREFQYAQEDMVIVQKLLKDKTVSLNQAEQLKDREEIDAREKARERERRDRKEPNEKVYDITLKLAEQKGLPPPATKTNSQLQAAALEQTVTPNELVHQTVELAVPNESAKQTVTTNSFPFDKSKANSGKQTNVAASSADKAPQVDAELIEAERILTDYLSILPKETILTINHANDAVESKP